MKKEEQKAAENYPEAPDSNKLKSFDLGIQEDKKGNTHSQISAYLLLVFLLTIIVIYYLST